MIIPQAFLAADALLSLYLNVVPAMVVHPAMVSKHVENELPFMATENLLMASVQAGGDRQALHERIRTHSLAASARLKEGAGDNDLIVRLRGDPAFPAVDFGTVLEPGRYVGRAPEQVAAFLKSEVAPIRKAHPDQCGRRAEFDV